MENMADADYVYLMVRAFDVIDILKERIRDDCEDSNAIKDFVSFLEADLIKREQGEKFEEIKRKYLFSVTEVHNMTPEEFQKEEICLKE